MASKKKVKTKSSQPTPAASTGQPKQAPTAVEPTEPFELNGTPWYVACGIVTAVAIFLRFYWLALKPFHHDEGVNGFFLSTLVKDGIYKYDPANYHGPTLYYISLVFAKVFGFETVQMRWSVAIFGVLMVVLAFYLKRYIGTIGALAAATLLAISPGMVYISRYFIHEIFFVFLSLAIVVAMLRFFEKEKAGIGALVSMWLLIFTFLAPTPVLVSKAIGGDAEGTVTAVRFILFLVAAVLAAVATNLLSKWRDGRPIYVMLASASMALLFATKETGFITLGTMAIACFSVWIWRLFTSSSAYEKGWLQLVIGFHLIVAAAAVYYRAFLFDGAAWLSNSFMQPGRSYDPLVYYAILLMIVLAAMTWLLFVSLRYRDNSTEITEPTDLTWSRFATQLGGGRDAALTIFAAVVVFVLVIVVFFTSFFTYADGFWKFFEAYNIWTKTGNTAHTGSGFWGYLKWGMKVESPIMIISAISILIAFARGKHRFAMFAGLWALGLFLAYSLIPYKTPWLLLSFLLPMCIVAGYGVNEALTSRLVWLKAAAAALFVVGGVVLVYQSYQLNFQRYDDEDMTYVYAHTRRGFLDMVNKIYYYADKSGKDKEARIEIVTPDYWPLTWYLKDYKQAMFTGSPVDANTSEMIVAKKDQQDQVMIQKYALHYKYVAVYPLRPGVDLVLLVRNDLVDQAESKDVQKVLEYKPVSWYDKQ